MKKYQKYQLKWMIDHDYSLDDLVDALTELQYSDPEDIDQISTPVSDLFDQFVNEVGFDSEIWACEDEWEMCDV